MKRWDLTLLSWFILVASVVYVNQLWLPMEPFWRICSLIAAFVGSFGLLLNYNIKYYSKEMEDKLKQTNDIKISDKDALGKLLNLNDTFAKTKIIVAIVGGVYAITAVGACYIAANVNQLYLYVTGWALFCLLFDSVLKHQVTLTAIQRFATDSSMRSNSDRAA